LPMEDFDPLVALTSIYDHILESENSQSTPDSDEPQFRNLHVRVLHAYVLTMENRLVKNASPGFDVASYPPDLKNAIEFMTRLLGTTPTENHKELFLIVYSLALLFWRLDSSKYDIGRWIGPYKDLLLGLLIKASGPSGDPEVMESNLDTKFYCIGLLHKLFARNISPADEHNIRAVLPSIEAITQREESSSTIIWKAIYIAAMMQDCCGLSFYLSKPSTCHKIEKDLSKKIYDRSNKKFADPGWENEQQVFRKCGLEDIMRQIPRRLFLEESVYNWQSKLPLFRFERLSHEPSSIKDENPGPYGEELSR